MKIKLYQRFETRTTLEPRISINGGYVTVAKYPGCPAKASVERECLFQFPTIAAISQDSSERLHNDQKNSLFPSSFQGKIVAVEYFLKCFVKHSAWNDFGEGKFLLLSVQLTHPF